MAAALAAAQEAAEQRRMSVMSRMCDLDEEPYEPPPSDHEGGDGAADTDAAMASGGGDSAVAAAATGGSEGGDATAQASSSLPETEAEAEAGDGGDVDMEAGTGGKDAGADDAAAPSTTASKVEDKVMDSSDEEVDDLLTLKTTTTNKKWVVDAAGKMVRMDADATLPAQPGNDDAAAAATPAGESDSGTAPYNGSDNEAGASDGAAGGAGVGSASAGVAAAAVRSTAVVEQSTAKYAIGADGKITKSTTKQTSIFQMFSGSGAPASAAGLPPLPAMKPPKTGIRAFLKDSTDGAKEAGDADGSGDAEDANDDANDDASEVEASPQKQRKDPNRDRNAAYRAMLEADAQGAKRRSNAVRFPPLTVAVCGCAWPCVAKAVAYGYGYGPTMVQQTLTHDGGTRSLWKVKPRKTRKPPPWWLASVTSEWTRPSRPTCSAMWWKAAPAPATTVRTSPRRCRSPRTTSSTSSTICPTTRTWASSVPSTRRSCSRPTRRRSMP